MNLTNSDVAKAAEAKNRDSDLADTDMLLRILKSPHPQSAKRRELIKEIANEHNKETNSA